MVTIIWVLTGVNIDLTGDDGEHHHTRFLGRVVKGLLCVALLAPIAINPIAGIDWYMSKITSVVERVLPTSE